MSKNINTVTEALLATIRNLQSCSKEDIKEEGVRAKLIVEASRAVIMAEQVKLSMRSELGVVTSEQYLISGGNHERTYLQHSPN